MKLSNLLLSAILLGMITVGATLPSAATFAVEDSTSSVETNAPVEVKKDTETQVEILDAAYTDEPRVAEFLPATSGIDSLALPIIGALTALAIYSVDTTRRIIKA